MLLPTKKRGDSTWRGVISGSRKANVSGDFIKLIKLLLQFKRVTGLGGVYSYYRFWENLKYERQHLWRLVCRWSRKQRFIKVIQKVSRLQTPFQLSINMTIPTNSGRKHENMRFIIWRSRKSGVMRCDSVML